MTKENRNLLINTVVVLLVSTLLLLTLVFFIPTSSADKIFGTKVKLTNKEFFRLPPTVEKIEEAYKGERLLGTVYTVKEDNNYGYVRLKVAIDDKGLIVGIGQDINQTYPEKEHSQQVFNYIESLAGSKVANPESLGLDAVAKPTTVVTLGSVNKILDTVAIHAGYKEAEKPEPPVEGDVKFIRKDKVGEVDVEVYEATGTYESSVGEGVLTFEFMIDADGILLGYKEVAYGHTDGSFKDNAIKFLEGLVTNKQNINTVKEDNKHLGDITDGITDGSAPSSFTSRAIVDLIDKVAKFIGGDSEEDVSQYVTYEGTEEIDKKIVYVYKATNEYEYSDYSGILSFKFKVDSKGVLVGYDPVKYEHSEDGYEDFKTRTLAFIQKLIDKKVNIKDAGDVDAIAGSTDSIDGVKDLLRLVTEFIKKNPIEEKPIIPEEGIKIVEKDDETGVTTYQATGNYGYEGYQGVKLEGILSYEFSIDKNGVLVKYEEKYYGHTPSFKEAITNFLNSLVSNNQNINSIKDKLLDDKVDGITNSTFTGKAVVDLIDKVANFIEEGK